MDESGRAVAGPKEVSFAGKLQSHSNSHADIVTNQAGHPATNPLSHSAPANIYPPHL